MDRLQRLRATILSTIVRDIPKGFWIDARTRTRQAYLDVFHEVQADLNVVAEQCSDKLYQDRHFRMESVLAKLARDHGLAMSATLLTANNRHFVYATKGALGLTQAYVAAIGAMPQPARFREQKAAMNNIPKEPRLDLGDEPSEVLVGKDFYGLLAHNPAGRRFSENEQRLGMIQFCVPFDDCSGWAAEATVEEILAEYETAAPVKKPDRRLPWKRRDDERGGEQ